MDLSKLHEAYVGILSAAIAKNPRAYALLPKETPEGYASRTVEKMLTRFVAESRAGSNANYFGSNPSLKQAAQSLGFKTCASLRAAIVSGDLR
jgi:hypothetical protein